MLFGKQPSRINYDLMLNSSSKIPTRVNPIRRNIPRQLSLEDLIQNQTLSPNYIQPTQDINMNGVNAIFKAEEPIIQEPISQPIESNTGNTDNQRFLASLLGQGIGMIGASIAGRDPSRVASNIEELRYYNDRLEMEKQAREERQKQEQQLLSERQRQTQEQIQQSKDLMNPKSDISVRRRNLYSKVLGFNIPEEVSASDLKDNNVLQGLRQQQLMKLQPSVRGGGVSQPKPEKENKNPFQKEITEITIRSKNALDALDKIEKIVSQYGTKELSGPQEKQLEQLINNVSINYNKVLDPTSVVREVEAKQVAESLGIGGYGGYFTSTDTALQQIKSFKELVNNTKNNALAGYQNLPMPGTLPSMTEEDKLMIEEAKKNLNDPTNAEILRTWGIR